MFYQDELRFLCNTYKKSRLQIQVISPDLPMSRIVGESFGHSFGEFLYKKMAVKDLIAQPDPFTLYKCTDTYGFCYMYFVLPQAEERSILFIGPFIRQPFSPHQLLEIGERNSILPKDQKILQEFCQGLTVIPEESPLLLMLNTFCERIWGGISFAVVDVDHERALPVSPINEANSNSDFDLTLLNIKSMEKRYSYENDLIDAVRLGQSHRLTDLFSHLQANMFEQRVPDPIRNLKNYSIITNTLLRKAAENGGVHPIYIDSVSSSFAAKIEQINSVNDGTALIQEMASSYCRLVRKHSMKSYSPLIQKTIIFIESDLSANLTLSSLSAAHNVSPSYLCTLFKKETGKTVTQYIQEKRIKHASHLLGTTRLQIQTIALHCGIMDIQYFSKLFKKHTGKTPKEYRDSIK